MANRLRLKINEIKFYIQLREFDHIIEKTVTKIFSNGCKLLAYTNGNSKHQVTKTDCIIFLDVNEQRDRRLLLWDLFHEFGHHLDNAKLKKEDAQNINELRRRERTAWLLADEEFLKYPELYSQKDNYIMYRNMCLGSYGIEDYYNSNL